MHRNQAFTGVGTVRVDVVTFPLGTSRQYDVREAAGCRPTEINRHHSLQFLECTLHFVAVLMVVPRVTTRNHHHLETGQRDCISVVVDLLTRLKNRINPASNRNRAAVTVEVIVIPLRLRTLVKVTWEAARTRKPR
ncbi:Uncharacterised protein [Vibrio cholerae]|uniref:Uncharacterized protein n=1 Tax=Vibrio cholerae TaxID=666 RepID=A0A655XF17_VIBCL|nr:Uncharacterised protein [Vibrio cholerae]